MSRARRRSRPPLPSAGDAGRVVVLTDYDGTLTPIVATPGRARLSGRVRTVLRRLASRPGVVVGVISGRSLRDLRRHVGLRGLVYVGNHGLELRGPGLAFVQPEARRHRATLRRLARHLQRRLRAVPGAWVEWKGLTATIHWRNVPARAHRVFHRCVQEATASSVRWHAVRMTRGKRVVELRPPVRWDKGEAVAWLLRRLAARRGAWPAYLGDDRTDEDAFRAVNRWRGLSVVVGRRPGSAAAYRLRDSRAVYVWLVALDRTLQQRAMRRRRAGT